MTDVLITDTECYPNLWCAGFQRTTDNKTLVLRLTEDREIDRDRLRRLMVRNTIVTYNGLGYDRAMIWGVIEGLPLAKLKEMNDRIIIGKVRWWELDDLMSEFIPMWEGFPRMDLIDLMEPQPNAFAGLKTLNGRLHGRKMQDLPYHPDDHLTPAQIEHVVSYMGNDLDATRLLFDSLAEPLALRDTIRDDVKIDVRSKSDAQCGETIIKKRVETITKSRIKKKDAKAGVKFRYEVPSFIRFESEQLRDVLDKIEATDFHVKANFKVDMPAFLADLQLPIGSSIYTMGIGGLHSTEANRSLFADDDVMLVDADVASQYPAIILKLGLYPETLGPAFLTAYGQIREERIEAKRRAKEIKGKDLPALRGCKADNEDAKKAIKRTYLQLQAELAVCINKDQGLKIALNGCYGKLGSRYSALFAPHLMIAVTLTGQLTLLMLIERAEAAGIPVVSGNTDGVLFHCPRDREADLMAICRQWEMETGFELEFAHYRSIHNRSVNDYIAIKEDGSVKRKGRLMNPRKESMRDQLMHNPGCDVCSDAVVEWLLNETPVEDTIYGATDMRDFVTVVNVKGGAIWGAIEIPARQKSEDQADYEMRFGLDNFEYLGKVVRYYWGVDGTPIYYKDPHPATGNFKKVSKSDGAIPCMELPETLPLDIDFERYIAEANKIIEELGLGDPQAGLSKSDSAFNLLLQLLDM